MNTPISDSQRQELKAIIQANRELGEAYDDHTVDQLLTWMAEHHSGVRQPQTPLSWQDLTPREKRHLMRHIGRSHRSGYSRILPILALSIPLMAVASHVAHIVGVFGVLVLDALAIWTSAKGT